MKTALQSTLKTITPIIISTTTSVLFTVFVLKPWEKTDTHNTQSTPSLQSISKTEIENAGRWLVENLYTANHITDISDSINPKILIQSLDVSIKGLRRNINPTITINFQPDSFKTTKEGIYCEATGVCALHNEVSKETKETKLKWKMLLTKANTTLLPTPGNNEHNPHNLFLAQISEYPPETIASAK